jgi:hypothetical protein
MFDSFTDADHGHVELKDVRDALDASAPEEPRSDEFAEGLAREAKRLRVFMTHTPRDSEFMPTLSYRVDQEISRCEERLEALRRLRDRYSA